MRKDTAVAFYPIEQERREAYVTDGVPLEFYFVLQRHHAGQKKLWSIVHVPTPEQEDGRHLQRQIRTLKKEQTRQLNRIRGLLANQGVAVRANRGGLLEPLDSIRIWDGSPLPVGLRRRLELDPVRPRRATPTTNAWAFNDVASAASRGRAVTLQTCSW